MKWIRQLLAVFLMLICLSGFGQDRTLSRILSSKDDTAKVDQLQAYGEPLLHSDYGKAIQVFEASLRISENLGYEKGMATAYRKIGYVHGQEGRYKEAISHFRKALEYYEANHRMRDMLVCYNNIGANFRQFGKVDSSIHYYMLAIKKLDGWPLEKEAPEDRQDMLSTYALLHENIAIMYGNMEQTAKSLEYGKKSVDIATQVRDTVRLVMGLVSVSHAYYVSKDFRQSLATAREAARLAHPTGHQVALAKAFHLLSLSYTELNKPDSGIYAARQTMEYARNSDQQLYISAFLDLADAYHKKKEYRNERVELEKALAEFNGVDNIAFGRNVYDKLADVNYSLGQYKQAYDYLVKAQTYKDSMFSKDNRETVADLEVQYQTTQKEKALSEQQLQIAQKEVQLQKSRQYTLYSISATLVALLAAGLVYTNFKHKRKQHLRQLQTIQQEKELQLLQALMQGEEKERSRIAKDLHDGVAGMLAAAKMHFNSLLAQDKQLEHEEGYRQANRLLDDAAVEVRKTSHNLMPEVLLQYGLDEAMRRYCNNINNGKILLVQYDSWGEIGRYLDSFELSVYRIVQELLNNIVKHSKATQAIVQLSQQDHLLSITIEDNGVGFQDKNKKDGMGLHSLESRVKAMNGRMELEAESGGGVSAYLEFETTGLEKVTTYAGN